jgi:hypothetical protein
MNQVSNVMGQSQTHKANGAKVNDPGGFTTQMRTGGTVG